MANEQLATNKIVDLEENKAGETKGSGESFSSSSSGTELESCDDIVEVQELSDSVFYISPIDEAVYKSFQDMEQSLKRQYGFTLLGLLKLKCPTENDPLRFYFWCTLVNQFRKLKAAGHFGDSAAVKCFVAETVSATSAFWTDQALLDPVETDDALLRFFHFESSEDEDTQEAEPPTNTQPNNQQMPA